MSYSNTATEQFVDFSFCESKDIGEFVSVRVDQLWGNLDESPASPGKRLLMEHLRKSGLDDLLDDRESEEQRLVFVTVQLFSSGIAQSLPLQTKYRRIDSIRRSWGEWIRFPTKYAELAEDAYVSVELWDMRGLWDVRQLGKCRVGLFECDRELIQGRRRLRLTPLAEELKYDKLFEMMRRYDDGDIVHEDWLDALAMERIREIRDTEQSRSTALYIHVTFPQFDFAVTYGEAKLDDPLVLQPHGAKYCLAFDPEMHRDNPAESKHRRLLRGYRSESLDRELKPNPSIRDQLNTIVRYPPGQELSDNEKNVVWKFRYYLASNKRALTKFVKCVDWNDPIEAKQATGLLGEWAEISIDDALELLSANFTNHAVRSYAVAQLRKATDDELVQYLLQLVQAIKFEYMNATLTPGEEVMFTHESSLAGFLIERALGNRTLGNFFYWYLMVECDDRKTGKAYAKVMFHFVNALSERNHSDVQRVFERQGKLVSDLARICSEIQQLKEPRPRKVERLREYLGDAKNELAAFAALPLPLDPQIEVVGIRAERASVFKSTMMPLLLHFSTSDGGEYPVIFKTGDDMRQDQLVVQIITLMDRLLRKESLDLRLTPYCVLATRADQGMSQFVASQSLAAILAENNNSILAYLRKTNPDPDGPYGVAADVMETYVKSCAGYCVITYLLGVGDRHLDNLLLTAQGHLFHVDFGYILGRDPKPFPPPMKLCKEMVEAMGGMDSLMYQRFKSHCFVAFSILRKSSSLILNLFSLMVHSNIPDIAVAPDQVVAMVQDKFRLDLSEEDAMRFFQTLISDSVRALFPQVIETIHKWAQYWRN
ncbi:Phosphatidylinositol (PI) 3-kinase [Coemansia sp. RSA 2706]|nr:Phosphatidylinositol (PI) 3-kinase [Coemansia sp. RSA 2706]KAJ2321805.1 Phosphatidylinositol (PI) 3-kinase [Coemansia sp. RSA 2704]KAJ2324857.1 Phosphatidylinositol (PI) 3-kinase [Coemansia sp. RSA 2702]KAJ2366212.1 Phosphatidylinositol (PI) 3-kinase [Coemansia sp. RSA 2610]KAJ2392394.1 Phosphatidylinositol (PI) 3-kinase [Coemansia sp. RSA 2611]KAJ2739496.1 Phosphatidylinositol (PI) 3-kinase [Coemansia sp. Cherry 401B]